jgi:glucose-1-phosphate thymidylyltransferase
MLERIDPRRESHSKQKRSASMKGVILAGGFGTRLRPFTLRLNKGMAPIYSPEGAVPQILYPLRTLVNSGVKDILVITSRDHCGQIVEVLGDGTEFNCSLTYRIQEMDRPVVGIAQALGLAKDFVGHEPFAVILGDNYYEDTFTKEFTQFEEEIQVFGNAAAIFLKEVADPQRFGVAEVRDGNHVVNIVEKPEVPVSKLAVTGLYLYTEHVFSLLPNLKPSKRNELEITDINNFYVNAHRMKAYILPNYWKDMGIPSSAKEVIDHMWSKNA